MDKSGIIKHREVFNAWLEGAEVEYYEAAWGKWMSLTFDDPNFYPEVQYRIKPAPKTIERWVNVFGPQDSLGSLYKTKQSADCYSSTARRACVKVTITYTEGEGLD